MVNDASQNEKSKVEEIVCEASGKVYLPPCQAACPLEEDIQTIKGVNSVEVIDVRRAIG